MTWPVAFGRDTKAPFYTVPMGGGGGGSTCMSRDVKYSTQVAYK